MAQFERFLEEKMKQTEKDPFSAYQKQADKGLAWSDQPDYATPYSSEDMADMFDDRYNATTYEERSAHYFMDHNYMLAKAKRYLKMSEDKNTTNNFSRVHDNKNGKTRRDHAREAALCFGKAWKEQLRQEKEQEKGNGPKTFSALYEDREKIMNLRLEGMIQAAEAKSRSYTHEQYMKLRAKLSCYTILRDQLNYYISKVPVEQTGQLRDLKAKLQSIESKINTVKRTIASTIPSAKDQWQQWIDMKGQGRTFKTRVQRRGVDLSDNASQIAVCLNRCLESMKAVPYPCTVPLKDTREAPITYGEKKKETWNRDYRKAIEDHDNQKIKHFQLEAIKRFEEYKVPSLRGLLQKGTVPFFMENPSAFMEMVFYAAPYYREQIQNGNWLKEYADQNPKFTAKVNLLCEMHKNFKRELLGKHKLQLTTTMGEQRVVGANPDHPEQYTNQALRGGFTELYRVYDQAGPSAVGADAASQLRQEEEFNNIDTDQLDLYQDLNTSFIYYPKDAEEENEDISTTTGKMDSKKKGGRIYNKRYGNISTSRDLMNESDDGEEEEEEEYGDISTTTRKESPKKKDGGIYTRKSEDISTSTNPIEERLDEEEEEDGKEDRKEENLNRINLEKEEEEYIPVNGTDAAFRRAPVKVSYQKEKNGKITIFQKEKPKNLKSAVSLRKKISDTALEEDLKKHTTIRELYDYYDACVKEFLKTEEPEYDKALLEKKELKDATHEEATRLRNNITATGLKPEELPKELKEVYDYYDNKAKEILKNEGRLGTVKKHPKRKVAKHKVFLYTNLGETYETQEPKSKDCWSCAGAGILNHYLRKNPPMTQKEFRAFQPKFRSMEAMGLDPNSQEDWKSYQDRIKDINAFTVNNQQEDRSKGTKMGNTFAMSDLYLQEFAKTEQQKNTAVHKMEFLCNSAKNNLRDDPNLLHNMEQKFKDTINEAIRKDSAVSLLMGKHYVTVTGINGDQLEVCDSDMSLVLTDSVYKVSNLFDPTKQLQTLELTWFERVEDPKAIAGQYQNLSYNEENHTFTSKRSNAVENISLCEGVDAWKTGEEKEEDISVFYTEGIYLPKTFTMGQKPTLYLEPATKSTIERNAENKNRIRLGRYQNSKKESMSPPKDIPNPANIQLKPVVKPEPKIVEQKKPKKEEKKQDVKIEKIKPLPDFQDLIDINPTGHLSQEHEEEFNRLRKTNPNLTLRGYRYYRRFRESQSVLRDPELSELLSTQVNDAKKAKATLLKNPKNADLSMAPAALLLDVKRRNDGSVYPEYEGNEKWNKEWIQSWAAGKEKRREELLLEMLPQVVANITILSAFQLQNGWIEKQMESDYVSFTGTIRRMSAMNRLMEEFPDVEKSLQKNKPYIHAKLKAAQQMTAYVENYMLRKYGFSPINDGKGCTMQAPPKKDRKEALEKQGLDILEKYQAPFEQYSEMETQRLEELKKAGYFDMRSKLEKWSEKLGSQEELKKDPLHRMVMASEKAQLAREEKAQMEKQERRKTQNMNPGVTEEMALEAQRIQKLMQEVQKATEKDPKNKKPLAKENFPTMEQLKNGWVKDMYRNHTRELIELMQNGGDETDETQKEAVNDLKMIISMEINTEHGVRISLDGKSCGVEKPGDKIKMKRYIDGPLSYQYAKSYSAYMGLDAEEVLKEYEALLNPKKNKNRINVEEDNKNEIIEEKDKKGSKKKGTEDKKDPKKKSGTEDKKEPKKKSDAEDKKEPKKKSDAEDKKENINEIIEEKKDNKDKTGVEEKEENLNEIILEKKEDLNEIILNEEEEKLIIDEDYDAKVIRPLTKEEQEFWDNENKNREEKNWRPPLYAIAFLALRNSSMYTSDTHFKNASRQITARGVFKKGIHNGPMGAMAPLIQSVGNGQETVKIGFNKEWLGNLVSSKSNDAIKKEACQKRVDELIKLNLGNAFNGFKLPSPEELQHGWIVKTLQNKQKSFQLFEVIRKAQGVPKLAAENATAKKFLEEHAAFKKMVDALVILNDYVNLYLKSNLGFEIVRDIGTPKDLMVENKKVAAEDEENMKALETGKYMEAYQAVPQKEIEQCAEREPVFVIPNKERKNK